MENKGISIKRAKLTDVDKVFDFIVELENEIFDKNRFKRIYRNNLSIKSNIYLLAWDREPVGYLSCHVQSLLHHCGSIAEIQEMYVVPEKRGQGIGKLLLDKLKEIAGRKNILQIELTSNIRRRRAHKFYYREHFILTSKKFVCKDF